MNSGLGGHDSAHNRWGQGEENFEGKFFGAKQKLDKGYLVQEGTYFSEPLSLQGMGTGQDRGKNS